MSDGATKGGHSRLTASSVGMTMSDRLDYIQRLTILFIFTLWNLITRL